MFGWPKRIWSAVVVVVTLYAIYAITVRLSFGNWQMSGLFGDTFGAFNALLSALALVASLYTLRAQIEQARVAHENEKLRVQPLIIPRDVKVWMYRPEYETMPDGKSWLTLPVVVEHNVINVSDTSAFNLKIDVYFQNEENEILLGAGNASAHPYLLSKEVFSLRSRLTTNSIDANMRILSCFSQETEDDIVLVVRIRYQNQMNGCFSIKQKFSFSHGSLANENVVQCLKGWANEIVSCSQDLTMKCDTCINLPIGIRMNGFDSSSISREEYDSGEIRTMRCASEK